MGSQQSIYCKSDDGIYHGYAKGWCFGRFIQPAEKGEATGNLPQEKLKSEAPCKYMVYTVLGAQRSFNSLAEMMVRSLFASISRSPPTCTVDVFILTDRANFNAMQPLVSRFGVRLYEVPRYENVEKSSMTKLQVFRIPQIHSYAAVLFVDIQILFNTLNLDSLFAKVVCRNSKLHVYREKPSARDFSGEYFVLEATLLSGYEIAAYEAEKLSPFTSAVFMFQPNHIMQRHFENVLEMIAAYPKNATYFKEQSFMNHYFAKSRAVLYTITAAELATPTPTPTPRAPPR